MRDYSSIGEVTILDNCAEVNKLLKSYWVLLDIARNCEGDYLFVLGCPYAPHIEAQGYEAG